MKLFVFGDGGMPEPSVFLRLIGNGNGVTLAVVDGDGKVVSGGHLLKLS